MGIIYAIGGGEIRNKTTIELDRVIVNKAKELHPDKRINVLFIPTASHDYTPYYNNFHRLYTPDLDCKTEIAMSVFTKNDKENLDKKFSKCDIIYVGGGDTIFMLNSWKESGLYERIIEAYNRGVILCGLSAGAIWFFENMYTDSVKEDSFEMAKGDGMIKGTITPHYNEREEFNDIVIQNNYQNAIAIENNAMIEIIDGIVTKSFSSNNGNAYYLSNDNGKLKKELITPCVKL